MISPEWTDAGPTGQLLRTVDLLQVYPSTLPCRFEGFSNEERIERYFT